MTNLMESIIQDELNNKTEAELISHMIFLRGFIELSNDFVEIEAHTTRFYKDKLRMAEKEFLSR